ncbi:MAG: hypothetical protein ACOH5I_13265 [Oligoflexus sp.]
MSISNEIYYKFLGIFTSFIILTTSCTQEQISYEVDDPLFQAHDRDEEKNFLVAQPISSRLTGQNKHLAPYIGHLILGNEYIHVVIAGVPPLPYQTEEHPLILRIFQKTKNEWLELENLPELRVALRDGQGRILQPVALNHQMDQSRARIELRYGDANSWQQEPLLVRLSLGPRDNRLQLEWRYQDARTPKSTQHTQARYQIRLRAPQAFQQNLKFSEGTSSVHILQQGLDMAAVVQLGDWQWQNHAGSALLTATTDQSQIRPLGFHYLVGRFGMMELAGRYLPYPECAFFQESLPRKCVQEAATGEQQQATVPVQVRLAARTHPTPYYSRLPALQITMPGLQDKLKLPVIYGEVLDLHLPTGSRISFQQKSSDASQVVPEAAGSQATEGVPPVLLSFDDSRQFKEVRLPGFTGENPPQDVYLSILPLTAERQALNYKTDSHDSLQSAILVPYTANPTTLRLEEGSYQLSLFHKFGPLCQENFLVKSKSGQDSKLCMEETALQKAVQELQTAIKAWKPQSMSYPLDLVTDKALELVADQQQLDGDLPSYWFYDPGFSIKVRIMQKKNDPKILEKWQNFRESNRNPSVFLLKQFVVDHAPYAYLELGCPTATISVHDYESLAKAIFAHAFDIFGCQNLRYEDQLFHAIDRLQGNRDEAFMINPAPKFPETLIMRRAHPVYYSAEKKTDSQVSLGAGAIVSIIDGTSHSSESSKIAGKHRLKLKIRTAVFSPIYQNPSLRINAIRNDGSFVIIGEQGLNLDPSKKAGSVRDFSLEIPPGTSYLRAEIFAELPESPTEQRLRLATSQYWPIPSSTGNDSTQEKD